MCNDDIRKWIAIHDSFYPGFRKWFMGHGQSAAGIAARWGALFADMTLAEVESASKALRSRENQPHGFGNHPYAVEKIAKAARAQSYSSAPSLGGSGMRCRLCGDTGKRSVFLCDKYLIVELQRLNYIDEWGNWLKQLDDVFFGRVVQPEQPSGPLAAAMARLLGRPVVVSAEPVLTLYANRSHSVVCRCTESPTATRIPKVIDTRQDWPVSEAAKLYEYVQSEVTRMFARNGIPMDQMREEDW